MRVWSVFFAVGVSFCGSIDGSEDAPPNFDNSKSSSVSAIYERDIGSGESSPSEQNSSSFQRWQRVNGDEGIISEPVNLKPYFESRPNFSTPERNIHSMHEDFLVPVPPQSLETSIDGNFSHLRFEENPLTSRRSNSESKEGIVDPAAGSWMSSEIADPSGSGEFSEENEASGLDSNNSVPEQEYEDYPEDDASTEYEDFPQDDASISDSGPIWEIPDWPSKNPLVFEPRKPAAAEPDNYLIPDADYMSEDPGPVSEKELVAEKDSKIVDKYAASAGDLASASSVSEQRYDTKGGEYELGQTRPTSSELPLDDATLTSKKQVEGEESFGPDVSTHLPSTISESVETPQSLSEISETDGSDLAVLEGTGNSLVTFVTDGTGLKKELTYSDNYTPPKKKNSRDVPAIPPPPKGTMGPKKEAGVLESVRTFFYEHTTAISLSLVGATLLLIAVYITALRRKNEKIRKKFQELAESKFDNLSITPYGMPVIEEEEEVHRLCTECSGV